MSGFDFQEGAVIENAFMCSSSAIAWAGSIISSGWGFWTGIEAEENIGLGTISFGCEDLKRVDEKLLEF